MAGDGPGAQYLRGLLQFTTFSQQVGQLPGIYAHDGPGAQYLHGPVQVTTLGQQVGQPLSGIHVAGIGPGTQSVQVTPFGQQPGQPRGGIPVAGIGPGPQSIQVTAPGHRPPAIGGRDHAIIGTAGGCR